MDYKYNISVVVPLYNEAESLPELYAWIKRVMEANNFTFEVIFVNDGSTDKSWEVIEQFANEDPQHMVSSFVVTMARALPCTVDSVLQRGV